MKTKKASNEKKIKSVLSVLKFLQYEESKLLITYITSEDARAFEPAFLNFGYLNADKHIRAFSQVKSSPLIIAKSIECILAMFTNVEENLLFAAIAVGTLVNKFVT